MLSKIRSNFLFLVSMAYMTEVTENNFNGESKPLECCVRAVLCTWHEMRGVAAHANDCSKLCGLGK